MKPDKGERIMVDRRIAQESRKLTDKKTTLLRSAVERRMTNKTPNAIDLLALAERCEAAMAGHQAELIEEAWRLLHPSPRLTKGPQWERWIAAYDVLEHRLSCDAFTDAALTLVPGGWTAFEIRSHAARTHFSCDLSRLTECDASKEDWAYGRGKTLSLAISAAALRAWASDKERE